MTSRVLPTPPGPTIDTGGLSGQLGDSSDVVLAPDEAGPRLDQVVAIGRQGAHGDTGTGHAGGHPR